MPPVEVGVGVGVGVAVPVGVGVGVVPTEEMAVGDFRPAWAKYASSGPVTSMTLPRSEGLVLRPQALRHCVVSWT